MAITKLQSPNALSPIHNPLIYTWSSDNIAEDNFSFGVNVKYNSATIYTDVVYPTNNNRAYIDLKPIVENYIDSPDVSIKLLEKEADKVQLQVVEIYGTPPTSKPLSTETFAEIEVFNVSFTDIEFNTLTLTSKFLSNKAFTDNPDKSKGIEVLRGQPLISSQLIAWASGSEIEIKYYDDSNTLLSTFTDTINECDLVQLDVNQFYGDIGVPNIEDVYYIDVTIADGETVSFEYVEPCYNPSSLVWQNKYGSFDTFVFNHNLIDSNEIESYSYMKKYGGWSGNSYTFDLIQHREVNYKKKSKHKGEIVSDYMSQDKRNWLANSLLLANKVWIFKEGILQAINVTDLRYTVKDKRFDELKDLIVKFDYSYRENSILS